MFYYLASKIPLISNKYDKHRLFKIFVTGTTGYLILHAYFFSKSTENISFIQNYRKYLYYIWAIDLIITGVYIKFIKHDDIIEFTNDTDLNSIIHSDNLKSPFIKKSNSIDNKNFIKDKNIDSTNQKNIKNCSDNKLCKVDDTQDTNNNDNNINNLNNFDENNIIDNDIEINSNHSTNKQNNKNSNKHTNNNNDVTNNNHTNQNFQNNLNNHNDDDAQLNDTDLPLYK